MGTVYLVIVLTAIVCIILGSNKTLQEKAINTAVSCQNQHKDCMEYNTKEQELVVNKQTTYFKSCLSTQVHKDTTYGYEKEKLVYTGATVGGVSMGGFHKTGGNYYKQSPTSKVKLVYHYYDSQKKLNLYNVKKIKLNNEELIEKARKSTLSKYLDDDCIVIEENIEPDVLKKLESAMLNAANTGNMNMARNINAQITTLSLPTKEKCTEIINWLSSCD